MWGRSKAAEATPLAGPHASSPVDTGAGLPWAGQIVAGLAISVDVLFNNIELRFSANYRFALFIGVLGTCVGSAGFLMQKNSKGKFHETFFSNPSVGDVTYGMFLAGMMLMFWSVAVGVLTFWSPYLGVGNGYLATWLGAVSSAYALGVKQRSVFDQAKEQTLAAGPVLWLLISSVTVMLALLPRAFQYIPWARALGFSTSAVSFAITLVVLLIALAIEIVRMLTVARVVHVVGRGVAVVCVRARARGAPHHHIELWGLGDPCSRNEASWR